MKDPPTLSHWWCSCGEIGRGYHHRLVEIDLSDDHSSVLASAAHFFTVSGYEHTGKTGKHMRAGFVL